MKTKYFFGNEISKYGMENGYVDYLTLASSFNHVRNNDIIPNTSDIGFWDIVNGNEYDEDTDTYTEIFQYYIIDYSGYQILSELTEEIIFYNESLDMYVWGITHYGTAWDRGDTMKKQSLPIATYVNGRWILSEPYDYNNRITCKPYGEMNDGTMVWQSETGRQYYRKRFFGKYYFVEL